MKLRKIKELNTGDIINFGDSKIQIIKNNTIFKKIKISVDGKDIMYSYDDFIKMISEDYRKILTHNCTQRIVCGQLGAIASKMALGSTLGTTIDGSHKGAGLTKSQGVVNHIQYYFDDQKRIVEWYKERGLNEKGWNPGEDPNETIDPNSIDLGEDEYIDIEDEIKEMQFRDLKVSVDNSTSQKFEEI